MTRTVNALDVIVDKINELTPVVEIRKDAWFDDGTGRDPVPDNYGVLTMTGLNALWADNRPRETNVALTLQIWLKPGTEEGFAVMIGEKLDEIADRLDLTWTLPTRSYDFEVDMTAWTWNITRWGPITWEEENDEP